MATLRIDGLLFIPIDLGPMSITTRSVLVTGKLKIKRQMRRTKKIDFILDNQGRGFGNLKIPLESQDHVGGVDGEPDVPPSLGDRAFAVLEGQLDIHAFNQHCQKYTFSELEATAQPVNMAITLGKNVSVASWRESFQVVIAPTGYDRWERESRIIVRREKIGDKMILTLDKPLEFKHYGRGIDFEVKGKRTRMAAEVILVSRQVSIRWQ